MVTLEYLLPNTNVAIEKKYYPNKALANYHKKKLKATNRYNLGKFRIKKVK